MPDALRVWTASLLAATVLGSACGCERNEATRPPTKVGEALDLSLAWLDAHPPGTNEAHGSRVLDALAWFSFSLWHPDPSTRERTGKELDRRLRAMSVAGKPSVVPLSYDASILRMKALRGIDTSADRAALSTIDLNAVLQDAKPTTRFWTLVLLARGGLQAAPDFSETWVAERARTGEGVRLEVRHAYLVYHEVVPALDFGLESPSSLGEGELAFVRGVLPRLVEISRDAGDPDGAAEALITAALVDARDLTDYREGIRWLVEQQQTNGSFPPARADRAHGRAEPFRHIMFVANWALLTSFGEATVPRPRDGRTRSTE